MSAALAALRRCYGIARSTVIYYGNPAKRRRARALYAQFVRPGDLCFDIGAHLGDRTGHFLALGARVVAAEPQDAALAVLRRLYGNDARVSIEAVALGAAPGTAELAIDPANPTVASIAPRWRERMAARRDFRGVKWRERQQVAVTTLDALIAKYGMPAFAKIDVEGSEADVLAGLSQPLPALSLEYLRGALDDIGAALAALERLGRYRYNRSPGESMRLAHAEWRDAAGILAEIENLPEAHGSGDIYARLRD